MSTPTGWLTSRMDSFCDVVQGQSPPGNTYNDSGEGLPFFQGKAEFGELHPTPVKWCSKPTKVSEPGDVLISVRAPVGPTNVTLVRSCIGRGLAALRPLSGIPTRFILYALRNLEPRIAEMGTGSTFAAIGGEVLRSLEVAFPPLAEQRRIVTAIEEHLSRLDAAVAGLKRVQVMIPRYRAAVLKAAVEGRLVSSSSQPNVRPLCDVAQIQLGKMLSQKSKTGKGSRPYLRNTNVRWGSFELDDLLSMDFDEREVKKYELRDGDVLICEGGEPGRAAVWRDELPGVLYQKALHRVRTGSDLDPEFLAFQLRHAATNGFLKKRFTGSTIQHLPREVLMQLPVSVPVITDQRLIVSEVQRLFGVIDAMDREMGTALLRAARLNRSILKRAFEGKLVPQDPNDEPASMLLERIRAARAATDKGTKPRKGRSKAGR